MTNSLKSLMIAGIASLALLVGSPQAQAGGGPFYVLVWDGLISPAGLYNYDVGPYTTDGLGLTKLRSDELTYGGNVLVDFIDLVCRPANADGTPNYNVGWTRWIKRASWITLDMF